MRHILFITSLIAAAHAFAEPAVQPGQTIDQLSQTKVSTTVNGQPGSLKDLLQNGKYKLVSPDPITSQSPSPTKEVPTVQTTAK